MTQSQAHEFLTNTARQALRHLDSAAPDLTTIAKQLKQTAGLLLTEMGDWPKANRIIAATAEAYGVSADDIKGTRRYAGLVMARHVAMHLIRTHTEMSYLDIGELFGRDHTSIIHGCNKISTRLSDPAFAAGVAGVWKE